MSAPPSEIVLTKGLGLFTGYKMLLNQMEQCHTNMKTCSDFDIILNDTCKYQIQNTDVYNIQCLHAGFNGSI